MTEEKKQSAGRSRTKTADSAKAESANRTDSGSKKQTETDEMKKKTSSSRTGGAKKNGQTQTPPKEEPRIESPKQEPVEKKEPNPSSAGNQMMVLLLAVLALFTGICFAFRDDVGVIGYGISYAFYGLFGVGALLVPFLLLQMALFWKQDVASGAVRYKYAVALFVLLFFSVMAHTIHFMLADIPKLTIASAFSGESLKALFEKGLQYRGGGFLGGLLASALVCAVGYPGTIIFGIIFLIVFVLTLFGLTPSECRQRYLFYRQRSLSARRKLREEQELRREEAQKQEQKRKEQTQRQQATASAGAKSQASAPKKAVRKKRADDIDREIFADDAFAEDTANETYGQNETSVYDTPARQSAPIPPEKDDDEITLSRSAGANARAAEYGAEDLIPTNISVETEGGAKPARASAITPAASDSDEEMPDSAPAKRRRKAAPANAQESRSAAAQAPKTETVQTPVAQEPKTVQTPVAQEPKTETVQTPVAQEPKTETIQTPVAQEPKTETAHVPAEQTPIVIQTPPKPARAASSDAAQTKTPTAETAPAPIILAPAAAQSPAAEEKKTDEISIRPPEMSIPAPSTIDEEGEEEMIPAQRQYEFPPLDLLQEPPVDTQSEDVASELRENADRIIQTLESFNVRVNISNVSRGPTITRYEVEPSAGTRVRSILNLLDDIALSLATSGVRSDGIITGKSAIGIEVPNKITNTVFVRELIEDSRFESAKSKLTASLGMDVSGAPVYLDIAKMPHLLIAGATGQGKSVCINSLLISLLYKARPDEVKLILIDPKKVELNVYNGLPHLLVPVVFEPKKAAGSLHWAVQEMERRFELIEARHVRNLAQYNASIADDPNQEKLPQIVIIIDELADLMMSAPDDVETSICRLAQKARAAGMHLIIGTQRPSTDVITGLIKANIPSRIAFTVSNQIDSRIIIDTQGAEKLIGRGDMLYSPIGSSKPVRVQGAFVSETEIENIIDFIKDQSRECTYSDDVIKEIEKAAATCGQKKKGGSSSASLDANDILEEEDPMLDSAIELAVDEGKISTSLIQRRLSLGYGRAAKLIDMMERKGIVSPPDGQRPRKVLISREQYLEMRMNHIDGADDSDGADDVPFDV